MKKLNISDLSVGDWVSDKSGNCAKILGIENWSDGYMINIQRCGVNVGNVSFASAHPIPITPEILEKNGLSFKESAFEETTMLGRHIRRIAVSKSDRGWWIHVSIRKAGGHDFVDMVFAVDFIGQFVHELQRAIRLAGIEKTIEL